MNFKFHDKKITGILTIIPKNERTFDEEMANYQSPPARTKKLKQIMGYEKHRIVEDNVCVSDLLIHGMEHLFKTGSLEKERIDAIILVTQSPDYFMPSTSSVIHGKLGLARDVMCMDINQGCTGYITGLMQAFLMLEQASLHKIVLMNADVLSRKVSKGDRNSYPLIGDGASITIVEKSDKENVIYVNIKTDGAQAEALIIPAGGFKMPSSAETAVMHNDEEGNLRSKDHLVMKGGAVFNFVQTEIPPLIADLIAFANVDKEKIDYYLFHQPNKFMLEKLADAMHIPYERMPNNIVTHFGNSSGVTIPTNITFNLGDQLKDTSYKVCLAGFGVGLTWGSMYLELGNLDFCHMIAYE